MLQREKDHKNNNQTEQQKLSNICFFMFSAFTKSTKKLFTMNELKKKLKKKEMERKGNW